VSEAQKRRHGGPAGTAAAERYVPIARRLQRDGMAANADGRSGRRREDGGAARETAEETRMEGEG